MYSDGRVSTVLKEDKDMGIFTFILNKLFPWLISKRKKSQMAMEALHSKKQFYKLNWFTIYNINAFSETTATICFNDVSETLTSVLRTKRSLDSVNKPSLLEE